MKFKLVNQDKEIIEEMNLNNTAREELQRLINKYPQYELSLDPNVTTFTCRGIINQDERKLGKTLKELRLNQNSVINIEDKREVELA